MPSAREPGTLQTKLAQQKASIRWSWSWQTGSPERKVAGSTLPPAFKLIYWPRLVAAEVGLITTSMPDILKIYCNRCRGETKHGTVRYLVQDTDNESEAIEWRIIRCNGCESLSFVTQQIIISAIDGY